MLLNETEKNTKIPLISCVFDYESLVQRGYSSQLAYSGHFIKTLGQLYLGNSEKYLTNYGVFWCFALNQMVLVSFLELAFYCGSILCLFL